MTDNYLIRGKAVEDGSVGHVEAVLGPGNVSRLKRRWRWKLHIKVGIYVCLCPCSRRRHEDRGDPFLSCTVQMSCKKLKENKMSYNNSVKFHTIWRKRPFKFPSQSICKFKYDSKKSWNAMKRCSFRIYASLHMHFFCTLKTGISAAQAGKEKR